MVEALTDSFSQGLLWAVRVACGAAINDQSSCGKIFSRWWRGNGRRCGRGWKSSRGRCGTSSVSLFSTRQLDKALSTCHAFLNTYVVFTVVVVDVVVDFMVVVVVEVEQVFSSVSYVTSRLVKTCLWRLKTGA